MAVQNPSQCMHELSCPLLLSCMPQLTPDDIPDGGLHHSEEVRRAYTAHVEAGMPECVDKLACNHPVVLSAAAGTLVPFI